VHSLHPRGLEVIQGLSGWAEKDLMRLLKPVESSWQPSDLLPDSSSPDFFDEVCKYLWASAQIGCFVRPKAKPLLGVTPTASVFACI